MRIQLLTLMFVIIGSSIVVPQTGIAADDWSNKCNDVVDSGRHTGEIGTPDDKDTVAFSMSEGEFATITVRFGKHVSRRILFREGPASFEEIENAKVDYDDNGLIADFGPVGHILSSRNTGDQTASWKVWAEGQDRFCFLLQGTSTGDFSPSKWAVEIKINNPDPAEFKVDKMKNNINSLKSKLEKKNNTISKLKKEVENKNSRIKKLENKVEKKNKTISELKAKLESQSVKGENVTIYINISSPDERESFVKGSVAFIEASSEKADISNLRVEFASQSYYFDSTGKVAIPLANAGTQKLTVVYQNTSETISFNVQEQTDEQQTTHPEDATSGGSAPGFGLTVAVVSLMLGARIVFWNKK